MLDFFDFLLIAFILAFIVKDWNLTYGRTSSPEPRQNPSKEHIWGDNGLRHRPATGAARSGMTAAVSDETDDEGDGRLEE